MGTYAVTGGGNGIGAAIVSTLKGEGHNVIAIDLKNADIEANLSTAEGRQAAVEGVKAAASNGLDGVVACAGVGPTTQPPSLVPSVNFFGATEFVNGLLDELVKTNGSVVMVGSNSAPREYDAAYIQAMLEGDEAKAGELAADLEGQTLYGGSKQAIHLWVKREAPDFARKGVRLNAIAPGHTATNMTAVEDPHYKKLIEEFLSTIPLGRGGQPQDQANAVSFLLSEAASFICGTILYVDGGHDAMFRPKEM